jgi:hypothetical protein
MDKSSKHHRVENIFISCFRWLDASDHMSDVDSVMVASMTSLWASISLIRFVGSPSEKLDSEH